MLFCQMKNSLLASQARKLLCVLKISLSSVQHIFIISPAWNKILAALYQQKGLQGSHTLAPSSLERDSGKVTSDNVHAALRLWDKALCHREPSYPNHASGEKLKQELCAKTTAGHKHHSSRGSKPQLPPKSTSLGHCGKSNHTGKDAVWELQFQITFPGPPHQPGYLPITHPGHFLRGRRLICSAWWGLVNVQVGPPLPSFL